MVRCGIALYGIDPFHVDASAYGLRPALELRSRIASGGAILVRGRAYPLVGVMSMDALTIDLGAETAVRVGDRRS